MSSETQGDASGLSAEDAAAGGPGADAPGPRAAADPAHDPAAETAEGGAAEELTVEDILAAEQSAAAAAAGEGALGAAGGEPEAGSLAESYLEDLRRISAEYANYRKRTEANAELEKQRALATVVGPLLTVLDDLDRAEQHGDLAEGTAFATIAQKIRGSLERLGLQSYGQAGEPFDPQLHEAIAQVPVPGTETDTVLDVIERGYRLGELELRPAKVAVAVAADG